MPGRFVDASVFVHAYLRPRRELKPHERQIKSHARGIVTRINEGERVLTSVVHLSEVADLLDDWMPLEEARAVLQGLCTRESVEVLAAERRDLIEALAVGSEVGVGMSDALAVVLMRALEASDSFEGIRRISQ